MTWNAAVTPQIGVIANEWHKVPSGVLNNAYPPDGAPEPVDYTLIRTMPSWAIGFRMAAIPTTISFNYRFCFGLIAWDYIADSQVPLAEQPIPGVDLGFDWIYHASICDTFLTSATNVAPALAYNAPRFTLQADSRARRKLSAGTGILACWALYLDQINYGYNSTVNYTLSECSRSLFLEP